MIPCGPAMHEYFFKLHKQYGIDIRIAVDCLCNIPYLRVLDVLGAM